jgi:hypothetical protein
MPQPMLYGSRLRGYTPYVRGLQCGPAKWIILRIARKGKLPNPFILFGAMNKCSYHILLIIHAYNAGISWLRSYARLRLYTRLWSEDVTLVVCSTLVGRYDSGHTSRLRPTSRLWSNLLTPVVHHSSSRWACCMSYHLSCERLRMVGLNDYSIL